jgi:hypothetical protein
MGWKWEAESYFKPVKWVNSEEGEKEDESCYLASGSNCRKSIEIKWMTGG